MSAELVELRLPAFKSVREARVPIGPLTLIVGRNGSGKSNLLDGLAVLRALSEGGDLRDALDGGRDGPIVRGGTEGCAPFGSDQFSLGCSADIDGTVYHLDLEIVAVPTPQIVFEHLWCARQSGSRKGEPLDFLKTDAPQAHSADIVARWENAKRGTNPPLTFRAQQLLTSQVATRVPATSAAGRRVHDVATQMLEAISGIFILDPIPHQMREYVPERDSRLRRNADNLSAALVRLMQSPSVSEDLLSMTASLSEAQVSDLSRVSSELGDVMVTVSENIGGHVRQVPTRVMSDGTLRFLAIAAAVFDAPREVEGSEEDDPSSSPERVLVIEELENGLHPSQAALLLQRLQDTARERRVRTIATTHSTAMLDALKGRDHESVVVTSRDEDGWSRVTRLTDFPDYFEVVGRTSVGDAAVKDRLRPGNASKQSRVGLLRSILDD